MIVYSICELLEFVFWLSPNSSAAGVGTSTNVTIDLACDIQIQIVSLYLAAQKSHPAQALLGVLGFQLVLGNRGNQDFLYLLASQECLNLGLQGLLLLHSLQGILQ